MRSAAAGKLFENVPAVVFFPAVKFGRDYADGPLGIKQRTNIGFTEPSGVEAVEPKAGGLRPDNGLFVFALALKKREAACSVAERIRHRHVERKRNGLWRQFSPQMMESVCKSVGFNVHCDNLSRMEKLEKIFSRQGVRFRRIMRNDDLAADVAEIRFNAEDRKSVV